MKWTTIREAMGTTLATNLTDVDVYDRITAATSRVSVDAVVVLPGDPLLAPFAHGIDEVNIRVVALSRRATPQEGQEALDAMMDNSGAKSVRAAIEADPTLGNVVSTTRFQRMENWGGVDGVVGAFQIDFLFSVVVGEA